MPTPTVNYLRVIHCKQNVANINNGYRKGDLNRKRKLMKT